MTPLFECSFAPVPGVSPLGYNVMMYGTGATFVMTLKSNQSPPVPCVLTLGNCSFSKDDKTYGVFQMNRGLAIVCECEWSWKEEDGSFSMTLVDILGDSSSVEIFLPSYGGTINKRTHELSLSAENEDGYSQTLLGSPLSFCSAFKQRDSLYSHPPVINCLNNVKKEDFEIQESLLSGCLYLSLFNDTVAMRSPIFTLKGMNGESS